MDLTGAMNAASDGAPPSRVDVDALVGRERRRRRLLWTGGAVGGATGATLAVTLGMALAAGSPGGHLPAGVPPPVAPVSACPTPTPGTGVGASDPGDLVAGPPTEAPEAAIKRLNGALRAALSQALPPGTELLDLFDQKCAFRFGPTQHAMGYHTSVSLTDAAGASSLTVMVTAMTRAQQQHRDGCPDGKKSSCEKETLPDGTRTSTEVNSSGRTVTNMALVRRPDGTAVFVQVSNRSVPAPGTSPGREYAEQQRNDNSTGRSQPSLTLAQAIAIGRTPGLTLYP